MSLPREVALRLLRQVPGATRRIEALTYRLELSRIRASLSAERREMVARNTVLRDAHKGRRGFVIGNGPSLGSQNLRPLRDEITFVMSGFWKHPIVRMWQPSYYCIADSLFFDGSKAMDKFFHALTRRIHGSKFIVPLQGYRIVRDHDLLPLDRTFFVPFGGAIETGLARGIDFADLVPSVRSVSQLGVMTALYTGCNPIYLLGMDHDWLAHRGKDRHFYKGKTIQAHALAHNDLGRIPYKRDLESMLALWKGYETLAGLAESRGATILNATAGGFLDVFPRVKYESLFRRGKRGSRAGA